MSGLTRRPDAGQLSSRGPRSLRVIRKSWFQRSHWASVSIRCLSIHGSMRWRRPFITTTAGSKTNATIPIPSRNGGTLIPEGGAGVGDGVGSARATGVGRPPALASPAWVWASPA